MKFRRVVPSLMAVAALGAAACAPMVDPGPPPPPGPLTPDLLGRYTTGLGNTSGETVAFGGGKMYVTNTAGGGSVDVVSIADPALPVRTLRISTAAFGLPNSVAVKGNRMAVAVEAPVKTNPGKVLVFDLDGFLLATATVGALPDMVTFAPDGTKLLVSNEAEPNSNYSIDPEGSVSVVDITSAPTLNPLPVTTIGFTDFNVGGPRAAEIVPGIRIFGPGATVAKDLEPEYIAVDPSGATAWVTLQENNAMAKIDLGTNTVISISPLGLKDHSLADNAFDPSDQDGIDIDNWPVNGMYQPDSVAVVMTNGVPYLITANEGDARDYSPTFNEEIRVGAGSYVLDPTVFPNAASLKNNLNLGRLTVSKASGDTDGDGDFDRIDVYGARSFTVWDQNSAKVYDSGDDIEQLVAMTRPTRFNVSSDNNTLDNRSDNKGPEPEGVATGIVDGRTYAFVGLERDGGILVVDVSDPFAPVIESLISSRDYTVAAAPDSGPEVLTFVPASESPTNRPLLLTAFEISGTVTITEL